MKPRLAAWLGACMLGAAGPSAGQAPSRPLADLSLEQLRDVVVTTVSRAEERLDRAAASVYVIGADEIRRSGATTLTEALRLAPTLAVARADANQYAISARGFNNVLANKMLVLIDGRTVYTPLFSGVFWEAQDVMLEDVERIEVVTGPSTALWGSNAVNGLIHVITRAASATQGAAASVTLGQDQRAAALRLGAQMGADGHWRGYVKSYRREGSHRADGSAIGDQADGLQAGLRADWSRPGQRLKLQGDVYQGTIDQVSSARRFSGGNLLAFWERSFAGGASADLQVYLERSEREHPQTFAETLDTADIVVQYTLLPDPDHRLLMGAGYRRSNDRVTHFAAFGFVPQDRDMAWTRLFAQDHVALTPALSLSLAASVERNPFTGTEVLPSVRLAWQFDDARLVWASMARAVRAPSRVDRDFVQPAQPPYLVAGGPDFMPEVADVWELGYRAQPSTALSYSVTAFHHRHRRLRSLGPTPVGLQFQNGIEGTSNGIEAWARWHAAAGWRLAAGATTLHQKLRVVPGAVDLGGLPTLGNDPRQSWSLRSSLDLGATRSWDISVRRVGALPHPQVPAYTAIDSRLAWSPLRDLELALVVQNLADPRHPEWGAPANRVEFEREWLLQLRWRL